MKNTPKSIVIHCTDVSVTTLYDQFVSTNRYHKQREFPVSSLGFYVGYHRLITGGLNYYCRLDTDVGAHCNQQRNGLSMNFQSLGVCVGFDGDIENMPDWAYMLLRSQVLSWQTKYGIPNSEIFFHRDFATDKTCPGGKIDKAWLKKLLEKPVSVEPVVASITDKCAPEKEALSKYKLFVEALKALLNSQI